MYQFLNISLSLLFQLLCNFWNAWSLFSDAFTHPFICLSIYLSIFLSFCLTVSLFIKKEILIQKNFHNWMCKFWNQLTQLIQFTVILQLWWPAFNQCRGWVQFTHIGSLKCKGPAYCFVLCTLTFFSTLLWCASCHSICPSSGSII